MNFKNYLVSIIIIIIIIALSECTQLMDMQCRRII